MPIGLNDLNLSLYRCRSVPVNPKTVTITVGLHVMAYSPPQHYRIRPQFYYIIIYNYYYIIIIFTVHLHSLLEIR